MRRLFAIISIAVMAVLASSCYDDSKIFGELSNLGDQLVSMNDRLTKVENDLAALQGDINALAELSQALKSGIYIKSVTALADGTGYTITFSDDRNIVVKNAESDTAPDFAVGVMTVDGKLVWAVNGEPLKNGDKYVEVYAATPIFQVNDKTRKLEVSYDNGNTWVEVGDVYIKVEGSDNAVVASCIFSDVKVDENAGTVTFTLTEDGSKIVLPLSGVFELVIEAEKVVRIGENSAAIPYMVKGADENTVVRVFTAGRCNAEVRKDTILVTNVTGDREILVYADNCKGKTSIKQVKLTRERFSIYGGDSWISYEGGRVNINGISNIDFEVRIPEKVDWITQVETKAEEFFLTFDVAKNEACIFREGVIDLVRKGTDEVLMSWVIYQDANPNVSTTISNAEEFIAFLNTIPTGSYSLNEYTLTADIDLSGVNYDWYQNITAASNGNNSCEMVGASTFKGVLNGCGHKITGFNPTVELPDGTTFGLIPILCHGTIKNLEISGQLNISATGQADAGMLVGTAYNSTIENVTVNGKIVSTGTTVTKRYALGGAVGYAFACEGVNTIIDNVVVNVDTEATGGNNMGNGATGAMYGGVVGFSTAVKAEDQAIVIVRNCTNNGNMDVTLGRCSGIVATANTGTTIQSCTNNGDQVNKVQNGRIGNIVCNLSYYSHVIDCVNNGDVDATVEGYSGTVAGLVALISSSSTTISGGANYGTIRTVSTAGKYVGLLWANLNNHAIASGLVAGGKIIVDGVEREINESNYMEHIGYIKYPEDVTDIRWGGSDNPSESDMPTIREFAQEYVKIIDVWNANKGTVNYLSPIGVIEEGANYGGSPYIENVNYLPADTKIIVAGVELTLPQAFDVAVRSYLLLRGYDATDETKVGAGTFAKLDKAYTMDDAYLPPRDVVWGNYPYNEAGTTDAAGATTGNGGPLKMGTPPTGVDKVKVDLLDNAAERNCNFATVKNNGVISNLTSYSGNRIVGYYGCASAMRMALTYAYFFKYMLDNNLTDAASIAADVTFDTALFGEPAPAEPEVPAEPLAGAGTEADPYQIASADDMLKIKEHTVPGQTTFFKMTADVDMASVKEWETVNYSDEENYGRLVNFDGDNHTISNFAPETFTGKYPSLFGVFAGTIKNVKFVGANIVGKGGPSAVIGGYLGNASRQLAAHIENVSIQGTFTTAEALTRLGAFGGLVCNTTFINCQADVTMTSEREDMGAFAGQATGEIVMKNCTAKVNLTNTRADNAHRTGGFIGYLTDKTTVGTFENCSVEGVIKDAGADTKSHSAFMGGLIGWAGIAEGGKLVVKNCTSKVNVEGTGFSNNVGCLIGNVGTGEIEMTSCTAEGTITAGVQVGGVVGLMEKSFGTYTGVTAKVTINCAGKNYVGGIVGRMSTAEKFVSFTDCHYEGDLAGGSSIAGIIGAPAAGVDFNRCSVKGTISGKANVGGLAGQNPTHGVVKNCFVEGAINASGAAGGLIGNSYATLVENCYANVTIVNAGNIAGGLLGTVHQNTTSLEIKNCFATGNYEAVCGVGGIIGNLGVKTTAKISGVFSWSESLKANKIDPTNYASGAIIGNIGYSEVVPAECYISALRNPKLVFADYAGKYPDVDAGPETLVNELKDHDDIVKDNLPPALVPQDKEYKNDWAQRPYHGKAAAADATPCSIAKAFGWDETVWDLSGTLPKLK